MAKDSIATPTVTSHSEEGRRSPTLPVNPALRSRALLNSLEPDLLGHRMEHLSDSSNSVVRVEIADVEDVEMSPTTAGLKRCKSQVLRPYRVVLQLIGWRGFCKEQFYSSPHVCQMMNIIYPLLVVFLLFYTYTYNILVCQGRLNVRYDTQSWSNIMPATATTPSSNRTQIAPCTGIVREDNGTVRPDRVPQCGHIITTYVIPSVLHFGAYLMGFIYFRVHENEQQLYALMEQVFLRLNPAKTAGKGPSQFSVIRRLRLHLFLGVAWVLCSLGVQALFEFVPQWAVSPSSLLSGVGSELHWVLFALEMLGMLLMNCVNVAVVVNYTSQCEMLVFYAHTIKQRLQEKSIQLKDAMQELVEMRKSIGKLNGVLSKMTSLLLLSFAEASIIGFCLLILNEVNDLLVWLYRALYVLIWMSILIQPLFTAARMNATCERFHQIALEARVFGYQQCSMHDLDSFLNFLCNARLRVKLFEMPVRAGYLILVSVVVIFTVLLLFQTSVIGTPDLFF